MTVSSSRGKRRWKRVIRPAILERDNWRCTECGRPGKLEVHHVRRVRDGGRDDPDNLVTLCRGCHIEVHRPRLAPRFREWRELLRGL